MNPPNNKMNTPKNKKGVIVLWNLVFNGYLGFSMILRVFYNASIMYFRYRRNNLSDDGPEAGSFRWESQILGTCVWMEWFLYCLFYVILAKNSFAAGGQKKQGLRS
uniref:Photosystem I assembly protein Ycf4 n=1 Tax=Lathyrus brachypterus TaxID=1499323 RepID=A0A7R6R7X4_9FABA|nr:photosystem I assembly protein Ycf4 [Lathyrus brachypterus]